ncbi:glycoside hydrolase family 3 C-terminal domain-containing protein [Mucilaginibacter sp. X5P1]|uniref:glycoside hydrolase family 3 C-terminal domain-containing protein n=1 Tax=Mucilaginibacter sp. X5P1 TaxID=2723088 RepID=UPI00161A6937|nr:glycoside hydrolase family 3 C-terminal domain-containing protein [Mucilaginibacter sp. X5P1]MBB6141798.1 beta-glucosidase [Mucilaginibacter sp. X5P1]
MFKKIIALLFIASAASTISKAQNHVPVYLDDSQPINVRVDDALSRMTLQEKINMIHAQSKFSSPGVPRLGIPENWADDGPHGIRPDVLWDEWTQAGQTNDSCMAFPALTCLAATWNRDMSHLYGKSLGEEARYRNKNILLGPGVNIYRSPLNGRNFEYFGEDPFLTSKMVVPYIKGVQENGVAACVKHFALNNSESNRNTVNVNVDDRTLYEIYLPAFKAAVQEGGVWAIMGSYNRYKGEYCCQNEYLLNDILRKEWGFQGVVVSDWGGTHDTRQAIFNGLDMEFGSWTNGLNFGKSNAYDNYYLAAPYLKMIQSGEVGTKELDDKVRHILRLCFLTTMNKNRPIGSLGSEEHSLAARKIAEEGIVLLKNDKHLLPIDMHKVKRIAVIGENAIKWMTVGGGSSSLKAKYEISPIEGLKKRIGNQAEIIYARGYVGDTTGNYNGVVTGQHLADNRTPAQLIDEAVRVAKSADVVIFVGGLNKSPHQDDEGFDRLGLNLPYGQDDVIAAIARVNKNVVVVNISGNAVAMPWVNQVPAIVQGWFLGSESGNALAAILMGDVNPSGKLPFTFPVKLNDNGAQALDAFPGTDQVTYKEGIFVGYRWAEEKHIKPLFAFGHGLSYTTFEYGKVTSNKKSMSPSDQITFSVKVKNTGTRAGEEVVQLYISDLKSSVPRPVKELKGFEKIALQPNEEKTVTFTIDKSALSYFDAAKHDWVAEPGDFTALIGAASDDIRTKILFTLN